MINEDAEARSKPYLLGAEPQLYVADIEASCAFFTSKLGFAVAFTYGEPPFYGQVCRDGARLNLRCLPVPVIDPRLRDSEHLLAASITLDDADALFAEFHAADVPFHHTLRTEPWGARTFIVRDPDGNLILFAGQSNEVVWRPDQEGQRQSWVDRAGPPKPPVIIGPRPNE